jgi:single-stranded DNA-binding protein
MEKITPVNSWMLRGRLTDDIRINDRRNGPGRIANMRLACSEPVLYQGEVESRDLFVNVAVFDDDIVAEVASLGLQKGDRVEAVGRCALKTDKWNDRDTGEPRERTLNELQITPGMKGFGVTVLERKSEPAGSEQ